MRSTETYRDRYAIHSSGRQVLPSLGLTWANCIDVRLALSRRGGERGGWSGRGGGNMVVDGSEVAREVEVVFAPHLPRRSMAFVVDADGVRGKEGSMRTQGDGYEVDEWTNIKVEQTQQPAAAAAGRPPLKPLSANVPSSGRATAPPTKSVR